MSEYEVEILSVENESSQQLKDQVLQLTNRINGLADGGQGKIENLALAQETAQAIKPYIDRLITLNRLLNPVDRLVEKRQQIHYLQEELAEDVAAIEGIAADNSEISPIIANDLQGELAAAKRDRKLFISEVAPQDTPPLEPADHKVDKNTLLQLSIEERFERIFSTRFISLTRIESTLSVKFTSSDKKRYLNSLQKLWDQLFERDEFRPHVEKNRVASLANAFADYSLIFRSPILHGNERTTFASLREHFGAFFVNPHAKGLWYTRQAFYHKPIERGHWALVDRQYLNCTFKKPSIRLLMYARANGLPAKCVRQKTVVEDIYDRIIIELTLSERFFENCHSITRTSYQANADEPAKQVYLFYKDQSIRISGKSGTPHWKPTKARWPGVLPSITLAH
ncbi:MAG: hypothetical protein ACI8P2_000028 [Candidatus Latescibacterota bacterium]|jgi:hypothetical protein